MNFIAAHARVCVLTSIHAEGTLSCSSVGDHHTSAAGASDCASCVGVLLELARVLVANPAIKLSSPVVFLFNGAEETFLQAR
jgi:Zn-dependent M28 family amino/carboxypeptidase